MKENYTIVNGELYHYGIPGMRWGHKKGPKKSEKSVKKSKTKSKLSKGKKIAAGVLAGIGAAGVAGIAALSRTDKGQQFIFDTSIKVMNKLGAFDEYK